VVPHRRRRGEADQEPEQQDGHVVLGVEPDAREQPGDGPQAGPVLAQRASGHEEDRGPGEHAQGLRGEPVPEEHGERSGADEGRGGGLRAVVASELARHHRGEHDDRADREDARHAERDQAARGEDVGEAGEQDDQRGLVGVAPREVVAGGGEVELVAVRPVAG
jgi:hypothetical protein